MNLEAEIFGIGLGLGLLLTVLVWVNSLGKRSSLRREVEELKKHLHTQMDINSKGYEELKKELATLRKENENLRITVATLSNKPGRAELKTLQIWDKAIRILVLQSPAFASAWETAISTAKKDVEETDSGVKALVRKVFPLLPQSDIRTDIQ
ncbi:MAG: hypothetical protein HC769_37325 [Cyanobacteria bacterium CRU_2_1]|nr:hypothetical protein [Cyanobacteria bacterium RU_5_0]NJR63931.1 hypothetical protein [Cyanobacteria bacterium CRU_2_1]